MDLEDLLRQNAALGEQVKLLVRTEKRLYSAQRTIERQLERTFLLNRFALESSRVATCSEILQRAIAVLLQALRVDQCAGFVVGPDDVWRPTAFGQAPGFDAASRDRCPPIRAEGLSLDHPLLIAAPAPAPPSECVAALLRGTAAMFEANDTPEAAAIELVLPLRRRHGAALGAFVLRTIDTTISVHELLPSAQDLPFLELFCAHVESALDRVLLHDELAAFAAELEVKVDERTRDLEAARSQADTSRKEAEALSENLRQLFDHMGEAILAFDRTGRVVGQCSKMAALVFGKDVLEGEQIVELLFGDARPFDVERTSFEDWLSVCFDAPIHSWDEVSDLAPRDVAIRVGTPTEKFLELEFRRMNDDARGIDYVMMLATDETEKWRIEREARGKDIEHAIRLAAMRRLAAGGAQLFVQFMESTRVRLTRLSDLAGSPMHATADARRVVESVFQQVHTIKGDARTFGLEDIVTAAGELEDALTTLRASPAPEEQSEPLRAHIARFHALAAESLARGRDLLVEASPIGPAVLEQVTIGRSDIRELGLAVSALPKNSDPYIEAVRSAAAKLAARPFGEVIEPLIDAAPRWAERTLKQVRIVVDGRTHAVPPNLTTPLRGALTHMVRNSVAHGIEKPHDRERAGKPLFGTIRIACASIDGAIEVSLEDDGAGIDLEGLREKALQQGDGRAADGDLDLVFRSGLSLSKEPDELSGRGVGLAAARDELARAGYGIDVTTRKGAWTRFTIVRN